MIMLISDLHLLKGNPVCRKDNIAKVGQYEKVEYLFKKSVENNRPILSAGDQTDVSRDFEILEKLRKLFDKYKPEIYCVLGQHDMYLRTERASIMSVLIDMGYVTRLSDSPVEVHGFNVYGCNYLDEFVPIPETKNNILVIHSEITTEELAMKNMNFIDAKQFLEAQRGYKLILCGDIHRRFIYKRKGRIICNTGPIIRKDASKYFLDYEPKYFIFDGKKISQEVIPHNKDALSRKHIEDAEENEAMKAFSIQVNSDVDDLFNFKIDDILKGLIKKNKINKEIQEIIFNYEGDVE